MSCLYAGYDVKETSLVMQNFKATATCSSGYHGVPQAHRFYMLCRLQRGSANLKPYILRFEPHKEIHGNPWNTQHAKLVTSFQGVGVISSMTINAGCQMQWDNQWVQPQWVLSERLQSPAIHHRHQMAPAQKSPKHSPIFCHFLRIMKLSWYSMILHDLPVRTCTNLSTYTGEWSRTYSITLVQDTACLRWSSVSPTSRCESSIHLDLGLGCHGIDCDWPKVANIFRNFPWCWFLMFFDVVFCCFLMFFDVFDVFWCFLILILASPYRSKWLARRATAALRRSQLVLVTKAALLQQVLSLLFCTDALFKHFQYTWYVHARYYLYIYWDIYKTKSMKFNGTEHVIIIV